jgi:hypothetical protein
MTKKEIKSIIEQFWEEWLERPIPKLYQQIVIDYEDRETYREIVEWLQLNKV